MLGYFRRSIKPILWLVVIGFVGSIFLYWGMGYSPSSRTPPEVARIDGQDLSTRRVNMLYENYIRFYRSIFKEDFNESMVKDELRRRVLEELIREKILFNEAKRVGIRVKDEEVMDEIKKPFRDEKGNLDVRRYNQYLEWMSRRTSDFWILKEEAMANLMIERLITPIRDAVKVTDLEVEDYYYKITEKPKAKDLEEKKEELKKALCNQKNRQLYEDWYNSLREKAKIELSPNFEKS
ncbi:TPA: hypothetical protein DCX15_03990 [bacterium]|nr:hypothetical protein [bacterium]